MADKLWNTKTKKIASTIAWVVCGYHALTMQFPNLTFFPLNNMLLAIAGAMSIYGIYMLYDDQI